MDGLIAALAAGKLPQETLWIGHSLNYGMQDNRYKAAVQSGAVSLFDDNEQAVYSGFYSVFARYEQANAEEEQDWANLRALEKHPPPSPALDAMLRSALQMARIHRFRINVGQELVQGRIAAMGITPIQIRQPFKIWSACLPLHTPREEALKLSPTGINNNVPIP